ncbi:hypothetical protein [Saccharomonospora xinjiangensis]|uniref:Mce-associated membrane protein n=1 Tax=Saccharomonospora xinjiangensis XJ-54 TaxID=882086 RepID=I0V177_9PSEU|nr:hypothetical protein [Saccharomonospora xinjiangensis]EID53880.1 hypothetical protein SacxiDRAFT_1633 [Saccharomonospora xinjiangensis XJ-54]
MPSSRRRIPGALPPSPTRRPRVAGLRKPSPTKRVPEHTDSGTGTAQRADEPATPENGKATAEATETVEAAEVDTPRPASAAASGTPEAEVTQTEPTEPTETTTATTTEATTTEPTTTDPTEAGTTGPEETGPAATTTEATTTEPPEATGPEASGTERAPARKVVRDRPSPRPKARDRGTRRPVNASEVDLPVSGSGDSGRDRAGHGEPRETTGGRPAGYPVLVALLVATLVLSGLAVFFKIRHSEATSVAANTALVDVATTAEVKQAMEDAAQRLFSVNYQDMGATDKAAERFLAGDEVRGTYNALMGDYREQAAKQKIVVTTTAVRSAVVSLSDDRAKVMVYVDQVATRAGNEKPMGGPAAMWFEAERRDGAWKVADLNVYGSTGTGTRSGAAPTDSEPTSSQAGDSTEGN